MYYTYIYPSFLGDICLVADDKNLLSAFFCSEMMADNYELVPDSAVLQTAVSQLNGYFAGRLTSFDLPLLLKATDFEKKVWGELKIIPYGKIVTYGYIAERIGNKRSARAVGTACGKNPFAIIIPCHRVGSKTKGALSGYAAGIDKKLSLIKFEKSHTEMQ